MLKALQRGLPLALLALPLWAAEPLSASNATAANTGLEHSLSKMLLGLLLVIGLILFLGWLVRRLQLIPRQTGQVIQLVASQSLGPRDRLVLVQVGNQQILLGLSPGQITPLHVLAEPVSIPEVAPVAPPEFAQRLMEFMSRADKDKP